MFWVALMLVIFLGGIEGPGLFPTSGLHSFSPADYPAGSSLLDLLWHSVLPVFCLSYGGFAFLAKLTRGSILENLNADVSG